ncbi:hypothetical protein FGO68_gene2116 [Halteria grandinella]|uniref:Uncharacterized protein n=1 Tax=Halteria grandinella TaxID=5974 RepID=A0A8J8NUA6_HALGN|nr:hypothetical protein FGO68_gene2116 [Halteria grandinella]
MSSIEFFKLCKHFSLYPDKIQLDVLRKVLTKDAHYWPITLAKHASSESTLFFTYQEFLKGLEIIVSVYLKEAGIKAKDEISKETQYVMDKMMSEFTKQKARGGGKKRKRSRVNESAVSARSNMENNEGRQKKNFSPIIEGYSGTQSPLGVSDSLTITHDPTKATRPQAAYSSNFTSQRRRVSPLSNNLASNQSLTTTQARQQRFMTIQNRTITHNDTQEDEDEYRDDEDEVNRQSELKHAESSSTQQRAKNAKKKPRLNSTVFNSINGTAAHEQAFSVYFPTGGKLLISGVTNSQQWPSGVKQYLNSISRASQKFKNISQTDRLDHQPPPKPDNPSLQSNSSNQKARQSRSLPPLKQLTSTDDSQNNRFKRRFGNGDPNNTTAVESTREAHSPLERAERDLSLSTVDKQAVALTTQAARVQALSMKISNKGNKQGIVSQSVTLDRGNRFQDVYEAKKRNNRYNQINETSVGKKGNSAVESKVEERCKECGAASHQEGDKELKQEVISLKKQIAQMKEIFNKFKVNFISQASSNVNGEGLKLTDSKVKDMQNKVENDKDKLIAKLMAQLAEKDKLIEDLRKGE